MCYIHRIEEVCTSLTPLEGLKKEQERTIFEPLTHKAWYSQIYQYRTRCFYLRNEVIVVSQVCTAVDTAIAPMTGIQIGLESFGLGLLHHVSERDTSNTSVRPYQQE